MGPLVPGCRVGPRSGARSGVRPWALLVVGSAASLRPTSQSPGRQRQGTGALAGRVLAAQAAGVQPLEILQHGGLRRGPAGCHSGRNVTPGSISSHPAKNSWISWKVRYASANWRALLIFLRAASPALPVLQSWVTNR